MAQFVYASWNLKNLSLRSIERKWVDYETYITHENIQAYLQLIQKYNIDVIGFLEVTVGSGGAAVMKICSTINAAQTATYTQITTKKKTYPTRTGEYNALVYRRDEFHDSSVKVNKGNATEEPFPQKSSSGLQRCFLNRVPVLFKISLSQPQKTLQIITWHCPQPAHVDPDRELEALAESINDCVENQKNSSPDICIDEAQPLIISGDFNFNTDPNITGAWNKYLFSNNGNLTHKAYLQRFVSLIKGSKTTLVKKDPATYVVPITPVDFDDVLCNAYDTILIDKQHLGLIGSVQSAVVNHLQELVAPFKSVFTYRPPGATDSTQLQISHANKISDHCMVYASYQIL